MCDRLPLDPAPALGAPTKLLFANHVLEFCDSGSEGDRTRKAGWKRGGPAWRCQVCLHENHRDLLGGSESKSEQAVREKVGPPEQMWSWQATWLVTNWILWCPWRDASNFPNAFLLTLIPHRARILVGHSPIQGGILPPVCVCTHVCVWVWKVRYWAL